MTGSSILYPELSAVAIEISSLCNRKCKWCPNSKQDREEAYLETELYYKIIADLEGFDGEICFHLYNEPLLDKRLVEFIKYAKDKLPQVKPYIATNGDFMTYKLWGRLKDAGLSYALITQYDDKVSRRIQNIQRELPDDNSFKVQIFSKKSYGNRAGALEQTRNNELPLSIPCARPFFQLCINYKGQAILCCNDYYGDVIPGDLHNTHWRDIWYGDILKYYRERLSHGDRASLPLCRSCDMGISFRRCRTQYHIEGEIIQDD